MIVILSSFKSHRKRRIIVKITVSQSTARNRVDFFDNSVERLKMAADEGVKS